MSNSTLQKFVLTPVVLSAAIFATLTLPLALFGSKPVTIQLQDEPVFQGQLRDASSPYLGLATLVSLGAGFASIALTGWRRSTQKSSEVEAQLSNLTQTIQEKEAELEALKLSETRLATSGLKEFLDEESPNTDSTSQGVQQNKIQIITQLAPITTPTVNPVASAPLPSVRFLDHAPAKSVNPTISNTQLAAKEVKELNSQLQDIMAQMASVQAALSATPTQNTVSQESGKSWAVQEMVP